MEFNDLRSFGFYVSDVGDNYVEYSKVVSDDIVKVTKMLCDQYSIKINNKNVCELPLSPKMPFRFKGFADVEDFLIKNNIINKNNG